MLKLGYFIELYISRILMFSRPYVPFADLDKKFKDLNLHSAAFVIVLTALTFFSIQILEAIFGNGMVEVSNKF